MPQSEPGQTTSERLGMPVVFETDHELVVVKPAGLASELSDDRKGASLLERVRRRLDLPEARLPHRLDRLTLGLLLVAKDAKSIAWHGDRIRDGEWEKLYLARVATTAGEADLLGEHRAYLKRRGGKAELVRSGGKPCRLGVLAVRPDASRPGQAHVLIRLLTGRYHQIRAMLAGLGRPLVGDALYGGAPGEPYLEHARLSFRPCEQDEFHTLLAEDVPGREQVHSDLLELLGSRPKS
jgi:23S rRNA-/tRNA-specific pseudouridylate synthase